MCGKVMSLCRELTCFIAPLTFHMFYVFYVFYRVLPAKRPESTVAGTEKRCAPFYACFTFLRYLCFTRFMLFPR